MLVFHFKTKWPLPLKLSFAQAIINLKLNNAVWNNLHEETEAEGSICVI